MQGIEDRNRPAFDTAAALLRKETEYPWDVINPAEFFGGATHLPRTEYLREAARFIAGAGAVVLLSGWQDSPGVAFELDLADGLGIPAFEFKDYFHHVTQGLPLPEPVTRTHSVSNGPLDMPAEIPPRADVLHEAADLITGDRNAQYGPPTQDFQRSADAMTAMGYRANLDQPIRPNDVAILVALVKISRLQHSPEKRDNWTDLAGYAGCGYECAVTENDSTDTQEAE